MVPSLPFEKKEQRETSREGVGLFAGGKLASDKGTYLIWWSAYEILKYDERCKRLVVCIFCGMDVTC